MYRLLCAAFVGLLVGGSLPAAADAGMFPTNDIKFLYTNYCGECHGRKAEGTDQGPRIRSRKVITQAKDQELLDMIIKGIKTKDSNYLPGEYKEASPGWMMEPSKNVSEQDAHKLVELLKSWSQ